MATGLPRAWDEIAPGHLVIAQEALEYGWWEAIVIERNGDMLTLRFRDFPKLPKFSRHRVPTAVRATMPAAKEIRTSIRTDRTVAAPTPVTPPN